MTMALRAVHTTMLPEDILNTAWKNLFHLVLIAEVP